MRLRFKANLVNCMLVLTSASIVLFAFLRYLLDLHDQKSELIINLPLSWIYLHEVAFSIEGSVRPKKDVARLLNLCGSSDTKN
jgi:hypothetical protein